jgi:predicted DNA-binding ribbon-helix-helix protein
VARASEAREKIKSISRKGAKDAKRIKKFFFASLCVLATLREMVYFSHLLLKNFLGREKPVMVAF